MSSNQKFNITSKCLITIFLKGRLATLISRSSPRIRGRPCQHKLQWLDFELEIVSNQEGSYFVTVTVATVLRRKPLFPLKFLNGTSLASLKLKVVSTETISEDQARISATSFIEDIYRIIMYTALASLLSDGQWLKIGSRRNNFLISISTGYYEMNRYLYFSMPLCMNFEYNNSFDSVPSVAIANYSTKQCSQQLDNFSQASRHRLDKKNDSICNIFFINASKSLVSLF